MIQADLCWCNATIIVYEGCVACIRVVNWFLWLHSRILREQTWNDDERMLKWYLILYYVSVSLSLSLFLSSIFVYINGKFLSPSCIVCVCLSIVWEKHLLYYNSYYDKSIFTILFTWNEMLALLRYIMIMRRSCCILACCLCSISLVFIICNYTFSTVFTVQLILDTVKRISLHSVLCFSLFSEEQITFFCYQHNNACYLLFLSDIIIILIISLNTLLEFPIISRNT